MKIRRSLSKPVILIVGVLVGLVYAQRAAITMRIDQVMTPSELRDSGVQRLTPAQRAALDAWLNRYTKLVISTVKKQAETVSEAPAPSLRGSSCSPAVESTIAGDFSGWEGETIFKLSNGQIWQQAEYDYMYSYSYRPDVTIFSTSAGCRMKVEDEGETILVKRLK
jgi:hypothetical protein